jgi:hypothetical protein
MLVNRYQKSDIYVSLVMFIIIYLITVYYLIKTGLSPDNIVKNVIFTSVLFALLYIANKYISLTLTYQN